MVSWLREAVVRRKIDDPVRHYRAFCRAAEVFSIGVMRIIVEVIIQKPLHAVWLESVRKEADGVVKQDVEKGLQLVLDNVPSTRIVASVCRHESPGALTNVASAFRTEYLH